MGTERHLATAMLFLVALSVCLWLDVKTATDLLVSGTRAFVQLTAVGLGLKYIFTVDSAHPVFAAVAVMIVIAAYTASRRAKSVPRGFWVALVAVATGTVTALSLLVSLQVVRLRPRFVIPIGGIVVGSSMTIAANTMQRLADDFQQRRGQLEAALALGASQWEASLPLIKRAVAVGFGPTIDYTKTVGIIQLPGSMTGMIMGGASPQEAVNLQITITFLLLGALSLSCIVSALLAAPQFFHSHAQLLETCSVGHERQITIIVMFLVALSICLWIDVNTAADLLVGGIRAAAQLSAVGFAIKYIVAIESAEVACSGVAIMVLAAAHTASKRAKRVAGGFWVALWAIGAAVTLAFSLLAGLQVVRLRPGFVIPISGLVVGSSMTIAANTMQRLADDFQQRRGEVEAALALGASQWQASLPLIRKAVAVGFGPTLDYIKTYGVIQLPGAMVGMLMGGMPPQEAVNLQLSVTFFLLVPMALTSVVSAILTARGFFPAPGQLIEEASC
ncbi:unnamed protein product [Closterium sp. NIES-64]|nr:unnamed protein product [Closterium sp. NIES-64]